MESCGQTLAPWMPVMRMYAVSKIAAANVGRSLQFVCFGCNNMLGKLFIFIQKLVKQSQQKMWMMNEMKRGSTKKKRNQHRKKKVLRKRNFWCSMYNREGFLFVSQTLINIILWKQQRNYTVLCVKLLTYASELNFLNGTKTGYFHNLHKVKQKYTKLWGSYEKTLENQFFI